jgi:hypothetical protein
VIGVDKWKKTHDIGLCHTILNMQAWEPCACEINIRHPNACPPKAPASRWIQNSNLNIIYQKDLCWRRPLGPKSYSHFLAFNSTFWPIPYMPCAVCTIYGELPKLHLATTKHATKELASCYWGPFMVGVPEKEKGLKDFLELFFTHNIYMKQT